MSAFSCTMLAMLQIMGAFAQDTVRIHLDKQWKSKEGYGFMTLARPSNDFIGFRGQKILPVYPDLSGAPDTAFSTIYYPHTYDSLFNTEVFTLTTDFTTDEAVLWVDKNRNLDFSDDGPGIRMNPADSTWHIRLVDARDTLAYCGFAMKPLRWYATPETQPENFKQFDDFFLNHPNQAGFQDIPLRYMFQEYQLNTRATQVVIEGDSFQIGLSDYNVNGRFDNDSIDRIATGSYHARYLNTHFYSGAAIWVPGAIIKPNRSTYEVLSVHAFGDYIDLIRTDKAFPKLVTGDVMPDFKFVTHNEDSITLHNLLSDSKYTLLDIWGSWCAPCRQEVPKLKELEKNHGDRLQVVAVTADYKKAALAFIEEFQITWPGVWMTPEFQELAHADGLPFHILIGPDKRILKFGVALHKVPEFIN